MKYSLVVPVYLNEPSIGELIEVVGRLDGALERSLEVVFVVDGSPDRSYERLDAALPTRIAREAAEHFCPACPNADFTRSATARSTSAEGVMTSAFLPDVSAMTSSDGRQPANRPAVSIEPVSRTRDTDG